MKANKIRVVREFWKKGWTFSEGVRLCEKYFAAFGGGILY
jgi:hypothetical protein